MANGRTTKAAVEKEIRLAERRLKTIEKHTGAKITINKDAILSNPNRAKTVESLKNIKWSALKQGASFSKDFINMKVEGKYWSAKAGWIKTETEVQGKDAVKLLQAVAHREKITGLKEKISISGAENVKKAIDWFNYFGTKKEYEKYIAQRNETIATNFVENLQDMLKSGKLSPEEKEKIKILIEKIRQDKQHWAKQIIDKKLYDIAGVNMFDSEDLSVDIANNYDLIMDALEEEVFESEDFKSMTEEDKEEVLKSARKRATKEARKAARRQAKEATKQFQDVIKHGLL